jgi:adenine-specific DNA-methyltransferase
MRYDFRGLRNLAALWQTSLTRLSVEIEGHPLGGGMLKLEPTEAANVLVPWPGDAAGAWLTRLAEELDISVRQQGNGAVPAGADTAILQERLGLSPSDCDLLRSAAETLRERRYCMSTPA